jgi:2,3-dihydro-2,3-dihydroxybenzoate dehydrogenase
MSGGRVAVVTGAAGGIGAAVVRALEERGAAVAAVDLRAPDARSPYVVDVRDPRAVDDLVGRVERELGPVDVLVNVAGVLRAGPVVALSDEDWSAVLDVNATGVFRMCRAVAPGMVARRRGCIVTVSSNAAVVARAHLAAYAAAKAAASHFTRCLGLELAPHGVRCNVVSPGSTDTDMLRAAYGSDGIDAVIRGSLPLYRTGIPLLRVAQPDDIAAAVVFLASDDARHITMQDLVVDGGAALGV